MPQLPPIQPQQIVLNKAQKNKHKNIDLCKIQEIAKRLFIVLSASLAAISAAALFTGMAAPLVIITGTVALVCIVTATIFHYKNKSSLRTCGLTSFDDISDEKKLKLFDMLLKSKDVSILLNLVRNLHNFSNVPDNKKLKLFNQVIELEFEKGDKLEVLIENLKHFTGLPDEKKLELAKRIVAAGVWSTGVWSTKRIVAAGVWSTGVWSKCLEYFTGLSDKVKFELANWMGQDSCGMILKKDYKGKQYKDWQGIAYPKVGNYSWILVLNIGVFLGSSYKYNSDLFDLLEKSEDRFLHLALLMNVNKFTGLPDEKKLDLFDLVLNENSMNFCKDFWNDFWNDLQRLYFISNSSFHGSRRLSECWQTFRKSGNLSKYAIPLFLSVKLDKLTWLPDKKKQELANLINELNIDEAGRNVFEEEFKLTKLELAELRSEKLKKQRLLKDSLQQKIKENKETNINIGKLEKTVNSLSDKLNENLEFGKE